MRWFENLKIANTKNVTNYRKKRENAEGRADADREPAENLSEIATLRNIFGKKKGDRKNSGNRQGYRNQKATPWASTHPDSKLS